MMFYFVYRFTAKVIIGGRVITESVGKTKREARQSALLEAIETLEMSQQVKSMLVVLMT
jgi:dsRNA-specific ribonuclease